MSYFASVAGQLVTSGVLTIPLFGIWSADVNVASGGIVGPNVPLVIGDLSLTGYVYRQSNYGGSQRCLIVGGYGGWGKQVPPRHYSLQSGVNTSLVVQDAAAEVGEKVNVPNDATIGTDYVRGAGFAVNVIKQVYGDDWHVDAAGVTQLQSWPIKSVPSAFLATAQDGAGGIVTIATENYLDWLPGVTFTAVNLDGTYTNCGVTYTMKDDGELRLEVLTS